MRDSLPNPKDKISTTNSSTQIDPGMLYMDQDRWYFKTGKGVEVGPFRYRSEAQSNLERFMKTLENRLDSSDN